MSYHAINAATPLPSKIRAVQFFDRTGKQCDLLFGVHIYERATTASSQVWTQREMDFT